MKSIWEMQSTSQYSWKYTFTLFCVAKEPCLLGTELIVLIIDPDYDIRLSYLLWSGAIAVKFFENKRSRILTLLPQMLQYFFHSSSRTELN
jgi:hypothetical protein